MGLSTTVSPNKIFPALTPDIIGTDVSCIAGSDAIT